MCSSVCQRHHPAHHGPAVSGWLVLAHVRSHQAQINESRERGRGCVGGGPGVEKLQISAARGGGEGGRVDPSRPSHNAAWPFAYDLPPAWQPPLVLPSHGFYAFSPRPASRLSAGACGFPPCRSSWRSTSAAKRWRSRRRPRTCSTSTGDQAPFRSGRAGIPFSSAVTLSPLLLPPPPSPSSGAVVFFFVVVGPIYAFRWEVCEGDAPWPGVV